MTGRGSSSVQRSGQAPRATVSSAALNWSIASRPLAMAAPAWANSSASVIGGGRCEPAAECRPAAGGLRQCMAHVGGQREGRMRGEHGGETRPFHQCAILGPAHRAVVRIGPQQALRQVLQHCGMRRDVGAADIVGDALGTVGEGGVAQVADQRGDGVVVQRTGLDAPADRQRDQQDGIAERVFLGARGECARSAPGVPGRVARSDRRERPAQGSLRRIVHCSKKEEQVPHGDHRETSAERH